jgi:hypothetical protein
MLAEEREKSQKEVRKDILRAGQRKEKCLV